MLIGLLSIAAWYITSIVYFASRLGYKNSTVRGFRKIVEFVLAPPLITIVYVYVGIIYLITPQEPPFIRSSFKTSNLYLQNAPGKYMIQIHVKGKWGKEYTIDVYSDSELKTKVW